MIAPPPLKNDCFSLPPGHHWTPVDEALETLRARLRPVVGLTPVGLNDALGRILAEDVRALRSNPPYANSAVDGYGMRMADVEGDGPFALPLADGRAAAGQPFGGTLTEGHALRILTGAMVPEGVETIILEEDTRVEARQIAFHGPLKPFSNMREAGEDVAEGEIALPKGHRIYAQDLALLAALGIAEIPVFERLRIGVLSTGDEVVPVGAKAEPHQIYDANRPMLLAQIAAWGFVPVDLGQVSDDREALQTRFDQASERCDMILTSGGASAGDEDHVSKLLQDTGSLSLWRMAMKPGRPLALAVWNGVPVFGLPGNPVAAFVCALVFAAPAARVLAGADWCTVQGFAVPAAFAKRKKAGRREYLRAQINSDGAAEVFKSEGSGRISGLSWATGLVQLDDGARTVEPGDPVTFLPFAAF